MVSRAATGVWLVTSDGTTSCLPFGRCAVSRPLPVSSGSMTASRSSQWPVADRSGCRCWSVRSRIAGLGFLDAYSGESVHPFRRKPFSRYRSRRPKRSGGCSPRSLRRRCGARPPPLGRAGDQQNVGHNTLIERGTENGVLTISQWRKYRGTPPPFYPTHAGGPPTVDARGPRRPMSVPLARRLRQNLRCRPRSQ